MIIAKEKGSRARAFQVSQRETARDRIEEALAKARQLDEWADSTPWRVDVRTGNHLVDFEGMRDAQLRAAGYRSEAAALTHLHSQ